MAELGARSHLTHQIDNYQDLDEHHDKSSLIVKSGENLKIVAICSSKLK